MGLASTAGRTEFRCYQAPVSPALYSRSYPEFPVNEAHDALFDCRYMVKTLEKGLDIVNDNKEIDRKEFIIPRISTDRYIKMKNKMKNKTRL